MDIVRTFGGTVASQAKVNPDRARRLLMTGWRAKQAQLALAPDKRLPKSRQYAGRLAMDTILKAMSHPDRAAAISIFTPYEPLEAAGILPYSVEQMSSFLAGTKCEGAFLETAGLHGFCETMCSYHRTFLGALSSGIVPKPRFAVYTNLACDGNLITFPFLEQKLGIPGFCIDVPFERSEEAVADVARQIREMTEFVGDVTGKPVDEDRLREAVARGCESATAYRGFLASSPGKRLPSDMVSEMYAIPCPIRSSPLSMPSTATIGHSWWQATLRPTICSLRSIRVSPTRRWRAGWSIPLSGAVPRLASTANCSLPV